MYAKIACTETYIHVCMHVYVHVAGTHLFLLTYVSHILSLKSATTLCVRASGPLFIPLHSVDLLKHAGKISAP